MKKVIKKVLEPKNTFEQWAFANSVKLPKQSFKPNKKTSIRWVSAAFVAIVVCLAFIFPVLYSGYPIIDPEPELKYYLENETSPAKVEGIENAKELQEFFKSTNILFFDFNRILNPELTLYKNIANDNKSLTLSYYVENCIISFKDDITRGFSVNFRVVTYKNYKFADSTYFTNLSPLNNNPAVQYKITSFYGINTAFVHFSHGEYEYYLKIEYIDAGELTIENLQNFLSDFFI